MKKLADIKSLTEFELLDWLALVQVEICYQFGLRAASSTYYRANFLQSYITRERIIIKELKSRGLIADFTKYTKPRLRIVE
ncbi:MAG: hypothetical protein WCK87_03210 [Candidatus Saccharibacteria bacterium]|jgi:hypothetical protein